MDCQPPWHGKNEENINPRYLELPNPFHFYLHQVLNVTAAGGFIKRRNDGDMIVYCIGLLPIFFCYNNNLVADISIKKLIPGVYNLVSIRCDTGKIKLTEKFWPLFVQPRFFQYIFQ